VTPDDLRERLRAVLSSGVAVQAEVECPTCRGVGKIVRPSRAFTHSDVAEAIGTQRTSIANFLGGRQTFTMDVTLRLIDWLADKEATNA
jgi:hypothetical protein